MVVGFGVEIVFIVDESDAGDDVESFVFVVDMDDVLSILVGNEGDVVIVLVDCVGVSLSSVRSQTPQANGQLSTTITSIKQFSLESKMQKGRSNFPSQSSTEDALEVVINNDVGVGKVFDVDGLNVD